MDEGPGIPAMMGVTTIIGLDTATAALAHILRQNPDPEWRERVRVRLERRAKDAVVEGATIDHDAALMEAALTYTRFLWQAAEALLDDPSQEDPFS